MAGPILVDAHMHIVEDREKGRVRKQTYEIWEYGEKTDVMYSNYDGVVEGRSRRYGRGGLLQGGSGKLVRLRLDEL